MNVGISVSLCTVASRYSRHGWVALLDAMPTNPYLQFFFNLTHMSI